MSLLDYIMTLISYFISMVIVIGIMVVSVFELYGGDFNPITFGYSLLFLLSLVVLVFLIVQIINKLFELNQYTCTSKGVKNG